MVKHTVQREGLLPGSDRREGERETTYDSASWMETCLSFSKSILLPSLKKMPILNIDSFLQYNEANSKYTIAILILGKTTQIPIKLLHVLKL